MLLSCRAALAVLILTATPAGAQPVPGQAAPAQAATEMGGTGVPACDSLVAAYARCIASPGVPEATRNGLRQSADAILAAPRTPGAGEQRARLCTMTHEQMRQAMVTAFACDFPPAPATAPATAPALAPPNPAAQTEAKAAAYAGVRREMAEAHNLAKDLTEYLQGNRLVLGPKPGGQNFFYFGVGSFDRTIARLSAAVALPGEVPDVDPAAAALLAALQELNPMVAALTRYQSTRAFQDDGMTFARAQNPSFVARMEAAAAAARRFDDAVSSRAMAQDEERVGRLAKGSPAQRLLATSLSLRRAMRRYQVLQPDGAKAIPPSLVKEVPPFQDALRELQDNNAALAATLAGMSPPADPSCAGFSRAVDDLIGSGRGMVRGAQPGPGPAAPSEGFARSYASTAATLEVCAAGEARMRP